MSRIFVSYRRDDTQGEAGHLLADLRRRFGDDRVFMDIAGISPGDDFGDAIERAIAGCSVVLVLIGRNWLDVRDAQGQRRLDDARDWVRLEVEAALQGTRRVIPVLVQGAMMPTEAALPESMRALARRNAHEISARRWDFDFDSLSKTLGSALGVDDTVARHAEAAPQATTPRRPSAARWLWIAGTAGVVTVALTVILLQRRTDASDDAQAAKSGLSAGAPIVTEQAAKKLFEAPTGDFEKTAQYVAFAKLSAGLAQQADLPEDQARQLARARDAACNDVDIRCRQAVLLKTKATVDGICQRKAPAAADGAPEAERLRADMSFQKCLQSLQAPMLDESIQRSRDAVRAIKAG